MRGWRKKAHLSLVDGIYFKKRSKIVHFGLKNMKKLIIKRGIKDLSLSENLKIFFFFLQ